MRLLLITSSAPTGKGESFVVSEANAIASLGHDVILIPTLIRKGSPNKFKLHNNIRLIARPLITLGFFLEFVRFFLLRPRLVFNLFALSNDRNILNTLKNYSVIPKAIWLSGVIKNNTIEHIHAHWLTTPSTLAMLVGHLTGVAWSVTAHRGDIVANNALKAKFDKAAFIRFISKNGTVLAASKEKLPVGKIKILHMGVDLDSIGHIKPLEIRKDTKFFNIVCPANLIPVKGHDFLIDSVCRMSFVKKVKLFIVGDGELRRILETKVRTLGLEDIIVFCGHVSNQFLLSWYKTGEVNAVVLPSLDLGNGLHEGVPVSLMEAMAFSIPVISTRTGGIPELLEENGEQYGRLIEAGNESELARVLDEFVQFPEKNRLVAKRGHQRVLNQFNQQVSINELLKLFGRYV